jgi:hypothetical protein
MSCAEKRLCNERFCNDIVERKIGMNNELGEKEGNTDRKIEECTTMNASLLMQEHRQQQASVGESTNAF